MARLVARARHAIDIVEAGYRIDESDREWLDDVLAAVSRDADLGKGVYVFTGRLHPDRIEITAFAQKDVREEFFAMVPGLNREIPADALQELKRTAVSCSGIAEHYGEGHPSVQGFRAAGAASGVVDALALFAQDAEGGVFNLTGLAGGIVRTPASVRAVWSRVGVHLVSAARLRQRLRRGRVTPEAVIDPAGKIRHAEGELAEDGDARARLASAARAIDRARTTKVRATPERALELWQGLVDGRWSLVDHWESDGRRYVAAFENRPEVPDPRALTMQERLIVRYVVLGSSNKEIAFQLGLPHDSVETAVSRLLRKLRCRRRADLVALGQLERWRATSVDVGGAKLDVVEVDARPDPTSLAPLTAAERAVVARVLSGDTNEAIARRRRASVNTVANQLRSVYAKLGVGSRAELVRLLTRAGRPA